MDRSALCCGSSALLKRAPSNGTCLVIDDQIGDSAGDFVQHLTISYTMTSDVVQSPKRSVCDDQIKSMNKYIEKMRCTPDFVT
jgi:hypothetical protein